MLQAPEPQGLLRNDREVDGEALTDAQLLLPPTHGAGRRLWRWAGSATPRTSISTGALSVIASSTSSNT